jgi:hypothetical protein
MAGESLNDKFSALSQVRFWLTGKHFENRHKAIFLTLDHIQLKLTKVTACQALSSLWKCDPTTCYTKLLATIETRQLYAAHQGKTCSNRS